MTRAGEALARSYHGICLRELVQLAPVQRQQARAGECFAEGLDLRLVLTVGSGPRILKCIGSRFTAQHNDDFASAGFCGERCGGRWQ